MFGVPRHGVIILRCSIPELVLDSVSAPEFISVVSTRVGDLDGAAGVSAGAGGAAGLAADYS